MTDKPDRFAEIAKAVVFDVESFHDYGQKEKILALALREAAAEALLEACENASCECSSAAPVECVMCAYGYELKAKAAALRETKKA